MSVDFCSIPIITILCYGFIELLKRTMQFNHSIKNAYPLIAGVLGLFLGIVFHLLSPDLMGNSAITSAIMGLASGLSATGGNELMQRMKKKSLSTIDNSPAKYFITGDKHRHYDRLIDFCKSNSLRKKDVIIILGDAGFNFYGDERDDKLKAKLKNTGVTLFCLHGNKENRPHNIPTYGIQTFCGGIVYYEPKYPNILFARDVEIYRFGDKDYMVVGGAHSVDKIRCQVEGLPYWEDEMPDEDTKFLVESRLKNRNNQIDGFLTHTCPLSCLPTEVFISTKRATEDKHSKKKQTKPRYSIDIDRSTEEWLETLKKRTDFSVWYCGHYHVEKELGKIRMLHKEIVPLFRDNEERLC